MKAFLFVRSALFWAGFIITTVLFGSAIILAYLLPSDWRLHIARYWGRSNLLLLRLLCGLSYKVEGAEHIGEQNCIVLSKHQSTWETISLHALLPCPRWVFKRELLVIPFFGWALACTDPIAINRAAGRKAVRQLVEKGIDKLKRSKWIIIFPEGTRTAPGADTKYKMGGAVLAAESGYPVLPIAHNAGEFWPRHSFIKYPGCITVRVGPMIETKGRDANEIMQQTRDWIETQMEQIGDPARWNRKA